MNYMKSAPHAVSLALLFSAALLPAASAAEEAAASQEPEERDVFGIIKTAVNNNDRDLFLTALSYPLSLCINNELRVYQNAEALKGFTLAEIIGSQELLASLKANLDGMRSGEAFEVAYDNYQVMGAGAYVSDKERVTINFTDNRGIYEMNSGGCGGVRVPKLSFCGDAEQDALINMLALRSFWMFNRGVYENFRDHGYSRLEMTPGEIAAGGRYDFIFEGQKLSLVRDPSSFNSAPVFHDGSREYMILAPAEFGAEYCKYPGQCRPVPYLHVFSKKKGAERCDPGEIVLAEKHTLNFCPFDKTFNAEIRLFTEGFGFDQPDLFKNSYGNQAGDISLSFEERTVKTVPEGSQEGYDETVTFAMLSLKGEKLETRYSLHHNLVFQSGDTEILAVPAGDYEKANSDTYNLGCAGEDVCVRPLEKMLLFVRKGNGNCHRLSLDRKG